MESNRSNVTDEFFLVNGKILSRDSSVGCSSRANYYCRTPKGVPFDWERTPGTPKELPQATAPLPPLSPPPAVLSLALPKPCMEDTEDDDKPLSVRSRLKRIIKKCQSKLIIISGKTKNKLQKASEEDDESKVEDAEESFGFWSPERDDFEGSSPPRNSSSSSLVSAALSFSGGGSPAAAAAMEESDDHRHRQQQQPSISCVPLKISAIMDYVTKRLD